MANSKTCSFISIIPERAKDSEDTHASTIKVSFFYPDLLLFKNVSNNLELFLFL